MNQNLNSLTAILHCPTQAPMLQYYTQRENKHTHMSRQVHTHTYLILSNTKGTCAYKHTQVKVQIDRREVAEAPNRADNYNQGSNSQTLRRFSSKASPGVSNES